MGWFNGKREKKSLDDRSVLTGDVTDKIKPVDRTGRGDPLSLNVSAHPPSAQAGGLARGVR
jgi:hypothetical protein